MDQERFRQIQTIFRQALLTAPDEVAVLLASRCGGDDDLHRQVSVLLAAHREAGDFLEESPRNAAGDLAGQTLGAYRVVRHLGDGGMGAVFLAERVDRAFRKRVAIKVLRPDHVSHEVIRRFTAERQILAALDHPNIAKLLDGGTTPDGRPYIAMEYVEGKPLDVYCADRRLGVRQRLEIFLELCSAVEFAHANLVVHRDLKPSNVLVTAGGALKLLDFGIAKLLNPELSATEAGTTLEILRLLTPEYASPEQVRGGPVTTASDVYSLGVLLYELLAGRGPYAVTTGSRTEVLAAVCDREPEPPSSAVSRPTEAGARRLQPRNPSRLRRRLSGDLDAIVAKALRKVPEQRYPSVALLAEDVRRHLQGHPVRARRSSVAYRTAKFVRRFSWQVATAAVILALLLALGGRMSVEKTRAERALAQVEVERNRSEQVVEFLVALFAAPNPRTEPDRAVTARDMLTRGAERVLTDLAEQPEVQARTGIEIGRILTELGDYGKAETLLEKAVGTYRSLGDGRGLARSLTVLASLHVYRGELDEAGFALGEARALLESLTNGPDPDLANLLYELAGVAARRGRLAEGWRLACDALDMHRAVGGDRVDEAQMLNTLAVIRHQQGDLDGAETLYRQTLALRLDALGPDHLAVSETRNNLAALLTVRGKPAEAREQAAAALAVRRSVLGHEHRQVASAWHNLGGALRDLGDLPAAEEAFRNAVKIHQGSVGRSHHHTAGSLLRLATVVEDRGRGAEAESLYRDSLALHRATLGDRHAKTGENALYLARLLASRGRASDALALAVEAHETLTSSRGADHWQTAAAATVRGVCLLQLGDAAGGRMASAVLPRLEAAHDPLAARFRDDAWRTDAGPPHRLD